MKKDAKNNEKTITLDEILQKIEITDEDDVLFFMKAFFAGMKSQKEKLDRLVSKNKALKMDLEDCLERVEQMNLLFSAIEEEQEK